MHRRFPVASFALPSRSPAPTPKEAGWIHQLAAGESKAWARFVEEWSPRLYQYITANGLSETEAQTLLPSSLPMWCKKLSAKRLTTPNR